MAAYVSNAAPRRDSPAGRSRSRRALAACLTIALSPSIEALGLALPYVGALQVLTALAFVAAAAGPLLWIERSE